MACGGRAEAAERGGEPEDAVATRDGGLRALLRGLFWPFGLVVRVCSRAWRLLAFQEPHMVTAVSAPPRPCRRKRLRRVTRALLSVLPRWVQSALGFPGPRSIGVSLSPEIRSSPAKPDGKGSKRKQDDLDDEEEEDHPSWVEALSQELVDEGPAEDPDYEPSSVETDTEEYASHNNTESDLELSGRGLVIEDVQTDLNAARISCEAATVQMSSSKQQPTHALTAPHTRMQQRSRRPREIQQLLLPPKHKENGGAHFGSSMLKTEGGGE